jgi:hypothetical protein
MVNKQEGDVATSIHDVQLAQVFKDLWDYIKKNGEFQKPDHPQMGGMWSADTYVLNGYKALMTDGGYGTIINRLDGKFSCAINYTSPGAPSDFTVHFYSGEAVDLLAAALQVMKGVAE